MKPLQTSLAALLLASATAQGGIYTSFNSPTLNTTIPDANPTGISSTLNVSGVGSVLNDVSVYINVSGGYNGDLYAYLSYGGTSVVLLNRIGNSSGNPFGASTSGFGTSSGGWYNFVFNDSTVGTDIHTYSGTSGSPITGTYNTDRRTADPQFVLDTSSRGSSLASFNNLNPNGNWTIFFADMASGPGSSSSTLVSWRLGITAVPEPANVALGIFGGVFLVVSLARSRRVRDRIRRWRAAAVHWVNAV
jgi:subtilisin-like proprotein convertase family protein